MEGLLFLLLMLWLFRSAIKKKAPDQAKKPRRGDAQKEARARIQKAIQQMERPTAAVRQLAMDFVQQPLGEGQSHMQVTEDIHGHASGRAEYMGSMAADTSEGEDACDPALGHERFVRQEAAGVYAGEIGSESSIDISPRGILHGVMMSEILQRPRSCVRGRYEGGRRTE